MILEIAGFLGMKFIDKAIDGTTEVGISKFKDFKTKREYEKIKKIIYKNLIDENKKESYFENMQILLDESRIIDVLFNFSYIMINISMDDRKKYIDNFIEEFYLAKDIDIADIAIIKEKISEQFDYCFKVLNQPSEESRKMINQVLVQIANSMDNQVELISILQCDIEDLKVEIFNIEKMLSTSDIDLDYLHSTVKVSIDNLKVRFNKGFNVDVELSNWLNRFYFIDDVRKELYLYFKKLQSSISDIKILGTKEILNKLNGLIEDLLENKEIDPFLLEKEMDDFIDRVDNKIIEKYGGLGEEYYKSNDYNEWRNLCVSNSNLDNYRRALSSDTFVITGEAGIGKSHSIAHFIYNNYYLKNKVCIFVLGQHLNEHVDPVLMLEKYLHIPYTLQQFLEQLNTIAEENNCFIPFVIEGINEGRHSDVWKDYFEGLVGVFEKYTRVKLLISIRKTYISKCLPEKFNERDKTLVIEHKGFIGKQTQAITDFFEYYEVNMPTFPVLYSEFYNPLFLHTLCKTIKSSGNFKIEEYNSFTEIFKGYVDVVEKNVSERCNYQRSLKLVKKSIDEIIKYSLENKMRYGIKMDKFYEIIAEVIQKFGVSLNEFVQALIENGLFYTELYDYIENEEYVQFSYERYHNILAAQYLISNINEKDELIESIISGELSEYFLNIHSGIIEELFILIPEKYELEILDLLDEELAIKLLDPFLNSLIWRNKSSISMDTTIGMINKYIVVRPWYFKKLIEKLLIIAPIENHPLNALFLHRYLSNLTMPKRDSIWIESLYEDTIYESGILNTLLKLCKGPLEYTRDTKELIMILLTWSLASTNNIYRESAIRTMVRLMQDDLSIAVEMIKKFKFVDDGYVKEGLYCSIYGAVLRSRSFSGGEELMVEVFNDIFNDDEIYPHVIVRAHAKGIIDYLRKSNIEYSFDIEKTVPPYKSKWYKHIPTQEEIDNYRIDYKDENFQPYMYSLNNIIDSMATNTGEKSSMYGDFGRYIFEGWVEPWEYHFIPQDLSNIVTKEIIESLGYDYKLHGKFDNRVKSYDRHSHKNERIGKKYQRIASFEMIARLSDNFPPDITNYEYSDNYINWSSKKLEAILKADITSDEWLDFQGEEFIGNEEDDIKEVLTTYMYEGPWQFNYRGIDPTVLIEKPQQKNNYWENIFKVPDIPNEVWASKETKEPNVDNILFIDYCAEPYVVLEMYNTWKGNSIRYDEEPKEYFLKGVAVLAPKDVLILTDENLEVRKYAEGSNNYEVYTVFAREFFWSDAYKDFEAQVTKDFDENTQSVYIETGISYQCPMSYSQEVENVISSYSMPSKYIVEKLELKQIEDGKWYDKSGKLVCLDIQFDGYSNALIMRKDSLLELIRKQELVVAWGIYTEKKGYPYFYATRKVTTWDGTEINIEEFDTEQWKSKF
ncbi:hypothetical protein [Clostridium sp. Cult3]|uniref:hypothetical protein n=1 Tax=Clostridium sp. Cult3 TaxID=2079004 RepID=UPI001F2DDFED|nr:hypothetical protein [Clostridium sp. Cult3]MCF6461535.1 hypothetical protein [Clostridium sp. Cult3]